MRQSIITWSFWAALAGPATALAQDYPAKPVRVVVPYAPGGVTDAVGRLVAGKLAESMGQPFVVENRAGAGGTIATAAVAKAPADGYTLLCVFDSHATNPFLFKNIGYDTVTDFAPISLFVKSPQLIVVHPKLGISTLPELVQLARAKPGALNLATAGAATSSRLSVELFKTMTGTELTTISYKGGGPAIADLLGGQVDGMFASMSLVLAHVRAGKLRALAITSDKRNALVPGTPTALESIPQFEVQSWVALLAPAGLSREIVAKLHAESTKALAAPDVREKLLAQGFEVVAGGPDALGQLIRAELDRWGPVIRKGNITAE